MNLSLTLALDVPRLKGPDIVWLAGMIVSWLFMLCNYFKKLFASFFPLVTALVIILLAGEIFPYSFYFAKLIGLVVLFTLLAG